MLWPRDVCTHSFVLKFVLKVAKLEVKSESHLVRDFVFFSENMVARFSRGLSIHQPRFLHAIYPDASHLNNPRDPVRAEPHQHAFTSDHPPNRTRPKM